jgi:HEPN domain-containing protein
VDELLRSKRNDFIYRSFRDVADCDYIAARSSYRLKLFDQFLWSSLQAVEKYIKTIILLYDGDTRDLGHDLVKGFTRVEGISEIDWDFEPETKNFLDNLTIMGRDRYFSYPRGTDGQELIQLVPFRVMALGRRGSLSVELLSPSQCHNSGHH